MLIEEALTILGYSSIPSISDLKATYRKLALKTHPDKGGDESNFQEISLAFSLLDCYLREEEQNEENDEGCTEREGDCYKDVMSSKRDQDVDEDSETELIKEFIDKGYFNKYNHKLGNSSKAYKTTINGDLKYAYFGWEGVDGKDLEIKRITPSDADLAKKILIVMNFNDGYRFGSTFHILSGLRETYSRHIFDVNHVTEVLKDIDRDAMKYMKEKSLPFGNYFLVSILMAFISIIFYYYYY